MGGGRGELSTGGGRLGGRELGRRRVIRGRRAHLSRDWRTYPSRMPIRYGPMRHQGFVYMSGRGVTRGRRAHLSRDWRTYPSRMPIRYGPMRHQGFVYMSSNTWMSTDGSAFCLQRQTTNVLFYIVFDC